MRIGAGSFVGRVSGGSLLVPRKGHTWMSVYFPRSLQEVIAKIANGEDRSNSSMVRQLVKEALQGRGITIPEDEDDKGREQ